MTSIQKDGFSVANLSSLAAGWLGVATAVYGFYIAERDAEKAAALLREKMEFAKNLAGYFGSATLFSEQLNESLFHMSKQAGLGPLTTQFLQVNDVVKELGGWTHLTADQLKIMERSLYDVTKGMNGVGASGEVVVSIFQVIATGGPVGVRAIKALDDALVGMGEAAVATNGLVSKFYLDMVKRAKEAGVELDGVNEFTITQLKSAATGLNAIFVGLQASATASAQAQAKALGEMTDEEISHIVGSFTVTAEQGAGLAAAVLADFASMVDGGMSLGDALDALQPSISLLSKALTDSGVDGGAAFHLLTDLSNIAGDAIKGPLFDAIQGANQALKGLHNAGILNQEMFTALELTAVQAYDKIVSGGGSAAAANMAIAPTLQTLWSLQQDFGYSVDDATQALIDQAVEIGSVGDKHRPISEQMLLATQGIQKAVEGLAKVFNVDLTDSAKKAAKSITDELGKIVIPTIPPIHAKVVVDYDTSGAPGGSSTSSSPSSVAEALVFGDDSASARTLTVSNGAMPSSLSRDDQTMQAIESLRDDFIIRLPNLLTAAMKSARAA